MAGKPSLADLIGDEYTKGHRGPRCAVATLDLDAADAAAFLQALGDPNIPATAIHRALHRHGHKVSDGALQRHRRGACDCAR